MNIKGYIGRSIDGRPGLHAYKAGLWPGGFFFPLKELRWDEVVFSKGKRFLNEVISSRYVNCCIYLSLLFRCCCGSVCICFSFFVLYIVYNLISRSRDWPMKIHDGKYKCLILMCHFSTLQCMCLPSGKR